MPRRIPAALMLLLCKTICSRMVVLARTTMTVTHRTVLRVPVLQSLRVQHLQTVMIVQQMETSAIGTVLLKLAGPALLRVRAPIQRHQAVKVVVVIGMTVNVLHALRAVAL